MSLDNNKSSDGKYELYNLYTDEINKWNVRGKTVCDSI